MDNENKMAGLTRRHFLQVSAAGVLTVTTLGAAACGSSDSTGSTPASGSDGTEGSSSGGDTEAAAGDPLAAYDRDFTWISPRGTIEVLDDYAYWVAKEMGYFGDLKTAMEPGPSDGTATVKFVAVDQADMGFPAPGIISFAVENEMDLVSIYCSGVLDLFNIAFREGEGVADLKELEGKTILLGSAAWESIANPMLAAAGVDTTKITYQDAGFPTWGTALQSGQGDAALSWEGLRADWASKGLEFDYWQGRKGSRLPSNSLVVRRADIENPDRKAFLDIYLKGWAMGMEFAEKNPRAATEIVFKAMPTVAQNFGPKFGTESLMQIHQTFKGDNFSQRAGWGEHDLASYDLFFRTLKEIGATDIEIDTEKVILNDFIADANDFDKAQVLKDAEDYPLSAEMQEVDVAEIEASFFNNVIN